MTKPAPPKNHPTTPTEHEAVHPAHEPHGIPDGTEDAEAKGLPTSDRQKTETAAKK